jgi:hypothetical protein
MQCFWGERRVQTLVATLYGTSTSDNQRTETFVNNFGANGRNATGTEWQQQRHALKPAAAHSLLRMNTG